MPIELDITPTNGARIRVVGVGGGGGNAINSMIKRGLSGVDFIAANTDAQALQANLAATKVQIGAELTRGLGAGADPTIGQLAVEESVEDVREALSSSDMVFVTAGMGGGTGTGGAPVIARVGRELDALVVGIVTKPFTWEARKRTVSAEHGISELRKHVDALIVIPNQKLMSIIDKNTTFVQAFQKVDDVLYNATKGIADIISGNGYVNVDFADVRTIMKNKGDALMGIGIARGESRANDAAMSAINSPLLEGVSIRGAEGVLINITASSDISMAEVGEAVQAIEEASGEQANLIFGVVFNEELGDQMMVTVVATGYKQAMGVEFDHTTNLASQPQPAQIVSQPQPAPQIASELPVVQNPPVATLPGIPNFARKPAPQPAYPIPTNFQFQQQQPVASAQQSKSVVTEQHVVVQHEQHHVLAESACVLESRHEIAMAANGGGGVIMTPSFANAVEVQSQRSIPSAAPVGSHETASFDTPAYMRRHQQTLNANTVVASTMPQYGSAVAAPAATPAMVMENSHKEHKPMEKPAFLRKIMD
ncbi:MAG: cell division protein FtsZ [Candidatus Kapabacteria bacterium]|nr:cell division protein FtsZ [Candidatus Kapabacteria bacterium]